MTYPTLDEIRARYHAHGWPLLDELGNDLDIAESELHGAYSDGVCDHKKVEMICPVCRFDRARWRYQSAWCFHFGHALELQILKLNWPKLEASYREAVKAKEEWLINLDRWPTHRENIEAEPEMRQHMLLQRIQFILAEEAVDRRVRLTGKVTRRAVTDGYIRTGKTMMVEGERVPVVRKVEFPG